MQELSQTAKLCIYINCTIKLAYNQLPLLSVLKSGFNRGWFSSIEAGESAIFLNRGRISGQRTDPRSKCDSRCDPAVRRVTSSLSSSDAQRKVMQRVLQVNSRQQHEYFVYGSGLWVSVAALHTNDCSPVYLIFCMW